MRNLKSIRKRARAVAAAAAGPLGPLPVQRVVCIHKNFFSDVRETGASWEQIAALLEREGLQSRRGKPVSAAVLRALYARVVNEWGSNKAKPVRSQSLLSPTFTSPVGQAGRQTPSEHHNTVSLTGALSRAARLRGILKEQE